MKVLTVNKSGRIQSLRLRLYLIEIGCHTLLYLIFEVLCYFLLCSLFRNINFNIKATISWVFGNFVKFVFSGIASVVMRVKIVIFMFVKDFKDFLTLNIQKWLLKVLILHMMTGNMMKTIIEFIHYFYFLLLNWRLNYICYIC